MYVVVRRPDDVPIMGFTYESVAWDYCKWANIEAREHGWPFTFAFTTIRTNPKVWPVEEAFDTVHLRKVR